MKGLHRRGIALIVAREGTDIVEVLVDGSGAFTGVERFEHAFDPSSSAKASRFIERARAEGSVHDWELAIQQDDEVSLLLFSGSTREDGTLVIAGGKSTRDIARLYEDLLRINNEQANVLRDTVRNLSSLERDKKSSANAYDELMKLNNELATLHETLQGEIKLPSAFHSEIPPELDTICMRALTREPGERYQSALPVLIASKLVT